MKLYYNLYYRFYKLSLVLGDSGTARYNGILIFSLIQIFNFLEIVTLISIYNNNIYSQLA